MTDLILERILKTIRIYEMTSPGSLIVAAVSGGPDSVLMLYALNALKRKLRLGKIIVCNVDHCLRADESKKDSIFVRKLAASFDMEFAHKRIDVNKLKSRKISVEEAARTARYNFFNDTAVKFSADAIATAHTLDDQAETVIMRVIKGASLKGIVGIAPVRRQGQFVVIRPLIELEKSQIVDYLLRASIDYRIDSSNSEDIYFRNVVRAEIIPFLEKYNPRLKRALFNLAEHLREDYDFIEKEKALTQNLFSREKKRSVIALKDIVVQPRAIQKEILRNMLEAAGGSLKKLSFGHWKEMESLIRHKGRGSSLHLPGKIKVTKNGNLLVFSQVSS